MESAFPVVAVTTKLHTVEPVGMSLLVIGALLLVAGWFWLVFQNWRFNPIQGVLSVIFTPIWALLYGFFVMEHRSKSGWLSICVSGVVVGLLGFLLVVANQRCEDDFECHKRAMQEEEAAESSALFVDEFLI